MSYLSSLFFASISGSPIRQSFSRTSKQHDSSLQHRCSRRLHVIPLFAFGGFLIGLFLSGCSASVSLGSGPNSLVARPGSITFASLPVGTTATANITLVNETLNTVNVQKITTSNTHFSLLNTVNVPMQIPMGGSIDLAVTFTPTQAGHVTGDLIVSTVAGSSSRSVVHLSGQGSASTLEPLASLAVNATGASFGSVIVGSTATQSLVLTSTGSKPIEIRNVSMKGRSFKSSGLSTPTTLGPGQSATINLQFRPTHKGTAKGSLDISSNSASGSSVSVPVSGSGVDQAVQLSWDSPSSSDPVAGYRIYRSLDGSAQYQLLSSSLTAQTAFTDSSVQSGQTYEYYVTAVDTSGAESAPSNTATVAVPTT